MQKHLKAFWRSYTEGLVGPWPWIGAGVFILAAVLASLANQSNTWSPTTGTVTGLQLTTNYNNAFAALQSLNSGTSAPANDISAAAVKGQWWLDTSSTPNPVRQYSGTAWLIIGWLDQTNGFWIPNEAGGTGAVTAAATTDLCASFNQVQQINGTTGITAFGATCIAGSRKFLNFAAALTLTHNATSLILPNNAANITTAAGDTAVAEALGGGNWRVVSYQKANGASLSASANFTSTVSMNGVIAGGALATSQNNWAPSGIATANVVRLTCTAAGINVTGIVAPSPSVDGQVLVLDVLPASTNACTFTSNDAASTAANRFLFEKPIIVRPGRTLTVKYDLTSTGWVSWAETPEQLIAGQARRLRLLNVTNVFGDTAPATPNNQYKGVVEAITLEDAFGGAKRISGPITVTDVTGTASQTTPLCVADVTTSGAGGLDTGTVAASTWYHFWWGYNPTTNVLTCFFSVSTTAATITKPAGYTYVMRGGAIPTDASANKCFYRVNQLDRIAHYVATGANAGCSAGNSLGAYLWNNGNVGTALFNNPVLVSTQVAGNGLPVPTTAVRLSVYLNTQYKGGAGNGNIIIAPSQVYSGTNNGVTGTVGNQGPLAVGTTSVSASELTPNWMTLESANLSIASTGTTSSAISIFEWEDSY